VNYGGGMVKSTIQVAARALDVRVPFKMVTASRGKIQRAEPFSALYEEGKVRHVGVFPKLEDEMCAFTSGGYVGPKSPNRADAHIWGLAELFPAMTRAAPAPKAEEPIPMRNHYGRR
jgi:phage terminase large subunit-like protein